MVVITTIILNQDLRYWDGIGKSRHMRLRKLRNAGGIDTMKTVKEFIGGAVDRVR